jgi:large subunit ribosomal protein L23
MSAIFNYDKVKSLIYTEKSNKQLVDSKYYFHVEKSCNKQEIASIIKKTFSVKVKKINIINTAEKSRRFKGVEGLKGSYKKAIVTLQKGQSINFAS